MRKLLLSLYFITLSWTSAFSLTWTISFPVVFSCLFGILVLVNRSLGRIRIKLYCSELFLLAFLSSIWLSYLLNFSRFNSSKPTNHLIAYTFTCTILYFSVRFYLSHLSLLIPDFFTKVLKAISISVFFSAAFGLIEFFGKNFFNLPIDNYIPRSFVEEYQPTFLGKFIRLRSFVEESGHYALFIELFFPLMYYYFFYNTTGKQESRIIAYVFICVTAVAFILTFSSAGITIAAIVLIVISITNWPNKISSKKIITLLLICAIGISITFFLNNYIVEEANINISEALNILTLDKATNSGSQEDRADRITVAFDEIRKSNIINIIFGNGPAAYDTLKIESIIGLYIVLLLEIGFNGLFLFFIFIGFIFLKIWNLPDKKLRGVFIISISSALLHYLFIGNYFYPWFWLVCAILYVTPYNQSNYGTKV